MPWRISNGFDVNANSLKIPLASSPSLGQATDANDKEGTDAKDMASHYRGSGFRGNSL
jgi:hypothetical protein